MEGLPVKPWTGHAAVAFKQVRDDKVRASLANTVYAVSLQWVFSVRDHPVYRLMIKKCT